MIQFDQFQSWHAHDVNTKMTDKRGNMHLPILNISKSSDLFFQVGTNWKKPPIKLKHFREQSLSRPAVLPFYFEQAKSLKLKRNLAQVRVKQRNESPQSQKKVP